MCKVIFNMCRVRSKSISGGLYILCLNIEMCYIGLINVVIFMFFFILIWVLLV